MQSLTLDSFPVPRAPASADAGARPRPFVVPLRLDAVGGADAPAALLAGFAALVAWYGGDDEARLAVRAPDGSWRPRRVDLADAPTAAALVSRVRDTLAASADSAGDADAAARAPRFAWLDVPRCKDALREVAGEAEAALAAWEEASGVRAALVVDAARGAEGAAAMAGHLRTLLEGMAAGPARRLPDLPVLTAPERAERARWNATEAEFPRGLCLHQAFEAHVDADPAAVAVLYGDEAISYRELEARANRLAHHLRGLGVGPEDRVGICVRRSPTVVEAILGVLKAGGAYVPLDADYPAERLAHMQHTAGVAVLLTESALRERLLAEGVTTVLLDRDADAITAGDASRLESGVRPENLAYVIFTSGSTGQPKGIALAHRGVMNNLWDLNTAHRVGPADRVLLLSSLSFDMSVYETLGILAAGGAVVIPAPDEARNPARWAALCRQHAVTVWNSAPALLGLLCDHAEAHPAQAPDRLRLAFLGGDWVPVPLPDRVRTWAPGMAHFIVMGGATEASIHSIIYPVGQVDQAWRSIPYGVPMANQRTYVLDRHLRPVPIGVAGELFLGGVGLARGYTGRTGFTAERFVPDPVSGDAGARLYRTGDLARYGADGTIELLGRIDHQAKIRGFRIEPGEIEAALGRHPAVARAVVVALRDGGGEARLVAYVVSAEGADAPPAAELRAFLRGTLPDWMVPAAYVALDRLPLSPNGKLDRKALPAPSAIAGEGHGPRTPLEVELCAGVAALLGMERVGPEDDFFGLGGHSLAVTRLLARVRDRWGVEVPIRDFFAAPTVAVLAERITAAGADRPASGAPPLVPVTRTGPVPASFAQARLWFIDRMHPGLATYNIPESLRLSGPLDVPVLERALGEVVRRHEALRTTLAAGGDGPVQVVHPPHAVALAVTDLRGAADPEDEARRLARVEAARPFDLQAGPLFRAALLRMGDDEHRLLLTMHHAVGDGWSTGVLLSELSALYAAFLRGEPSPLAAVPVQYADYAAWQRAWMRGEAEARQLAYWRAALADAPAALELPTDRPRPPVQRHRGAELRFVFGPALTEAVRGLARREGVTPFIAFLAGLQATLARWSGQDDLVVGTPVAGRRDPALEGLIGFFVNTLAVRTRLDGDPTGAELLARVRGAALGAWEHQDVPFERVVEAVRPGRSLARAPLFQVMFALQNAPGGAAPLGPVRARRERVPADRAHFDLTLELEEGEDGIAVLLEYDTELFDRATAERLVRHWERAMAALAADPAGRLSALPLMDEAERNAVVVRANATARPYERDATVHALFAAQAARTPDAPAVVSGDEIVSYAELERRANRLAHHLGALGVGPEGRVGVCLERGTELVIAFLAVLKVGAAYVPLDPDYPAERLAWMEADAGVRVRVTSSALAGRLPCTDLPTVRVDDDAAAIAARPETAPEGSGDADALAYVVYTSGSTGRPKGIGIPHRGVVRLVRGTDYVQVRPDDAVAQASSASFDAITFEVWGALLNGARVVVIPRETTLDPAGLARALVDGGVTTLFLTTALFNTAVRERPEVFRGLRHVLFGGEAVDPEMVRRCLDGGAPDRLLHVYGPTESTTFASWHRVDAVASDAATVPIGWGVANTTLYVLDAAMCPAPVGVIGELYVGGDGLARGYLGRPALTAERFVPDPFAATPGARLYRTGDRVRWTEWGIEFRGRTDHQVKLRGFRIELGEIESVLLRHAGAREAVAMVREDVPGIRRLVAYAVPGNGAARDGEAVREALRRHLPDYMVPSAVVVLHALPLTPNGKVDRAALPIPAAEEEGGGFVAPRTPTEEALAGIWAEVLGARVGVHDDFFALGGHSLLAAQVVTRVRDRLRVDLPVRSLFEAPTVAALSLALERARPAAARPRIGRAAARGAVPAGAGEGAE
jgi:amino acid adenylation domain-containing protein